MQKILAERENVDQARYRLEGEVDQAELASRAAAEGKRQELDAKAAKLFTSLQQQITQADAAVASARATGAGEERIRTLENRRTNLQSMLDELYKNKGEIQGEVDRADLLGRARAAARKGQVDEEADTMISKINSYLKDLVYRRPGQ